MILSPAYWKTAAIGLALLVAIAVAGPVIRHRASSGCALDGMPVDPLLRVRVMDGGGDSHDFCCIRCAQLWLEHQARPPRGIYVADEKTGEEVEAGHAYFVRSRVATVAATENRIHAFARRADAERHAQLYGGSLLLDAERPF
jgi:hypothetical protein